MPKTTYTFGPFSIDSDSRLLFRDAERVPLPPKAADVLVALVEREGQLVTKDELLKDVWPDTFVEEGNLARHIFLLRKTLGETADGASYVETVPKRGYRFIGAGQRDPANVVTLTAEERTSEHILIEETDTPDPSSRRIGRRTAAVALALLSAAGLLGSFVWTRAGAAMPVRSVLVLPFANLSTDGDSEYYSDGLTEELIGAFSGVKGFRVVPRTTAFQFKGKSGDVRAIGRQLEVDAVLDGGVRRDGGRLRIHLSFTRVSDGQTIWSQTYDRRTQDVFATQQEIAGNVLRNIFPGEQRALDVPSPSGTSNLEAQNLYLRGKFFLQQRQLDAALPLFVRATSLDPAYAQAWAGRAYAEAELGHGYTRYPKDAYPFAIKSIQRALALNPRLALAHTILGDIDLGFLRDWEAAKRELETAMELDPNDGESHHWMSHYWVSLGRFKEGFQEARRALECDPFNLSIGSHQIWVELKNSEFSRALRTAQGMLRFDPQHRTTSSFMTRAFEESGMLREAVRERWRAGQEHPPTRDLEAGLNTGGPDGYWRVFVGYFERRRKTHPTRPTTIAIGYAHLGERQRALAWLEQAVEERDPTAVYMKIEPSFDALRGDARFQQIVKNAGIP
jgi:TolB-like protein/DNA-binding winged helix-turn-helix (wHTH) protein/Tfp pilus assembly protein PilF